jgi:hypothetical protein
MTGWKSIFLAARRSLVALGVLALLCTAGLVALYALADSLATQVAQLGSAVQDQRGQLAQKQENLRNVRSHIERMNVCVPKVWWARQTVRSGWRNYWPVMLAWG